MKDRDKVTMQKLRQAHGLCDKNIREWKATIEISKTKEATKGSTFETQLGALISAAQAADAKNMSIEGKHLSGTSLLDADIRNAAEGTAALVKLLKEGNEKKHKKP